jgi:excisionase family DNA binding protein
MLASTPASIRQNTPRLPPQISVTETPICSTENPVCSTEIGCFRIPRSPGSVAWSQPLLELTMPKISGTSSVTHVVLADAPLTSASGLQRRDTSRLLDEFEVASWLSISVRTLRNWRVQGGQIPFIRVGKKAVRYRTSDIEAWLAARVRTSTTGNKE